MLATDPLIPYNEILKLKSLKFLEIQFDSFYREHRDELIFSLNQIPLLEVSLGTKTHNSMLTVGFRFLNFNPVMA